MFPVNTSTVSSSVFALLHCCLHCNVVSQCIGVEITKNEAQHYHAFFYSLLWPDTSNTPLNETEWDWPCF